MRKIALWLLVCACGVIGIFADEPTTDAVSFEDGNHGWKLREYLDDGKEKVTDLSSNGVGLQLPVSLPKRLEYTLPEPQKAMSLKDVSAIVLRLRLPDSMPSKALLTVFGKDNDFLWRQLRIPVSTLDVNEEGVCEVLVPLAGNDAVSVWECCGHERPWNGLTVANLLEMGFRFELDNGDDGVCSGLAEFLGVTIQKDETCMELKGIRDLTVNTMTPRVGTCLEISFHVNGWITEPYDSAKFTVQAEVSLPEGAGRASETIHGYYYEDFLYDESDSDKDSCLSPIGEPWVKIKYCPRMAGRHKMAITIKQGSQSIELPPMEFEATAAEKDYHGFVHVDSEYTSYFRYDDGTVFNGLGMNVRSPFDDRYFHVAPYSTWENQGLQAYETLFKKYREIGINVVEVWMCSWWLALEWRNNARGFHGVGHYNQYRAWMLDRILQLAEENGIKLILVLNNHGKFGMTYDTEWAYNPYNVSLGGYLKQCEDYFSNERAKADFKKTADYITSRWGASPNLLAWKLFTEVDLTGQDIYAYQKDPNISTWHREMGAYLKQVDIYQHPVTTHWMLSYGRIDHATASVKELDFLSTDAYYSIGGGSRQMMELITGASDFGKKYGKPLVITEFGGSSYGDSMRNLMNQVELALFTGFFHEMGIVPMCWWFALVEDKNLHGKYLGYHRFTSGEDRRGMVAAMRKTSVDAVHAYELRGKSKLLFWVMDSNYYFTEKENVMPVLRKDVAIQIPSLPDGPYTVEYWNLDDGTVINTATVLMPADKITLPEFSRSIGVKVWPAKGKSAK
ncbi:MAG: hypothetical protein J6X55_03900 [Victivallales bacterium]|nr:hypothetical protein [Victivallales bacterium]